MLRRPGLQLVRRSGLALAALLLAAGPALLLAAGPAAAEAPCGTVIVPPGVGTSSTPAEVTGLHPLLGASAYNQAVAGVMYRPLFFIAPDHTVDWSMSIADHVDTLGDGTGFHVSLKPWVWSDGVPITADDVLYCLELLRTLRETWSGFGTAGMPDIIQDFHVDGPHDFTVTLKGKVNPDGFILNGLGLLLPLPRHAWGATTTDEMWQRQSDPAFFQVVDGPYRVGRFEMSRYLTLVANPAYSGPAPHVARIVVNFLEGTSPLRALQSGEADAVTLPFSVWDAAEKLAGYDRVPMDVDNSYQYVGLNFRNPAVAEFQDVRVRQAMADAIDQKLIIDLVFHGSGAEQHGPVPAEPATMLSPAAREGRFPVGHDPARARALLAEAGWLPGPDGIRRKDGRRFGFTLLISAGSEAVSEVTQVVQRDLADVGIDMRISEVTFSQVVAAVSGDPLGWEALYLSWTLNPYIEGQTLFGTGGVNNNAGYSDPAMDKLTAAINTDAGNGAAYAFQDYAAEQQPEIFMPSPRYAVLARRGLEGVKAFVSPMNTWQPEFLRLTGPLACTGADPS